MQSANLGDLAGIGRATAISLSKAGWAIALLARRADKLQETKDLCDNPSKVLLVVGDVSKEEDVLKLFSQTVDKFGEFIVRDLLHGIEGAARPGRLDMLFNVRFTRTIARAFRS